MTGLAGLWFGLRAPVSRAAYALSGFGLMGLKYAVEALVIHQVTGRWLTPLDYLNPVLSQRLPSTAGEPWLVPALLAWTLPFLWVGVSMTIRRAEDANVTSLVALLFFLPLVNYGLMLTLCALPSRPRTPWWGVWREPAPGEAMRHAAAGAALGIAIAVAMTTVSIYAFGSYGTTLFFGTPFAMGMAAAYVLNRRVARGAGVTAMVAVLTVVGAGGVILLFALEGLLCLMMAVPPAITLALLGAWLGRGMALRTGADTRGLAMALAPLPLLAGVEAHRPPPPVGEVVSVVHVAAPPEVVWRHVVSFSELDAPPAWLFRLGVAYPVRATIDGAGVGAVRRCEFSTGAFVEPITTWDEPRRLAFDVVAQPPAMHEWSPYRTVAARHLDGYLAVSGGEFRLSPDGGGTRLEGRTRYAMRVFPAAYWRLWSDAIIHGIHGRVLDHVRALAEASPPR